MSSLNYFETSKFSKNRLIQFFTITILMFAIRSIDILGVIPQTLLIYTNIVLGILVASLIGIGCSLASVYSKHHQRFVEVSLAFRGIIFAVVTVLFMIAMFHRTFNYSKDEKGSMIFLLDSILGMASIIALLVICVYCFYAKKEYPYSPSVILVMWAAVSLIKNYVFVPVVASNYKTVISMLLGILCLLFLFTTAKAELGYSSKNTRYIQVMISVVFVGVSFGYLLPHLLQSAFYDTKGMNSNELAYFSISIYAASTLIKYVYPTIITRKIYKLPVNDTEKL